MADKNNFPIAPAPFAPPSCGPCPPPPGGPCPPRPPFPRPVIPGTSQYIGARYVPKFADPIEWSKDRDYEQLEIVTTPSGDSYTSRCPVPVGVDISNTRYWAKTSSQSVQVEQYRQEVADLSKQVTDNNQAVDAMGGKIDGWQHTMDGWAGQVDQWEQTVGQASQEIAELQANDSRQDATITQHTQSIAEIQAKDTAQDASIKANADAIKAAQDTQVAFETAYEQDKAALQAADAQNAAAIARTDVAIKQNTKNIQDNAANIAKNAAEIAKHGETLTQYAGKFATLDNKDKEQDTKMDGIRADLTEAEAKIQQNADAISHLQQVSTATLNKIGALKDTDTQYAAEIAALKEKDREHDGRLDALWETFYEAEADIVNNADAISRLETNQGTWTIDHPGKSISQAVTANANAAQAAKAAADGAATTAAQANATAQAANATAQAAKTTAEKAAEDVKSIIETGGGWQESRVKDLENNQGAWTTEHPGKTISQAVTENANAAKAAADAAKAADTKATQANNAAQAAQTAADQAKTAADTAKTDAADALAQAQTAEETAQRAEQKAEEAGNFVASGGIGSKMIFADAYNLKSFVPIPNMPLPGTSKVLKLSNILGWDTGSSSGGELMQVTNTQDAVTFTTTVTCTTIQGNNRTNHAPGYLYSADPRFRTGFSGYGGIICSMVIETPTREEIAAYEAEHAAYQAAKEKAITDSGWNNGPAPADATFVYGPFDQEGLKAYAADYGMSPHMLVVAYPPDYNNNTWYIRSTKEIVDPTTDIGAGTSNTMYVTNEDNTAYIEVV